MYELFLCETEDYLPQILEHWLNGLSEKHSLRFLFLFKENRIRLFCSDDLSSVFRHSNSKAMNQSETKKLSALKALYWLKQDKGPLFPIKRYSQFEDTVNKSRIIPFEKLIEEFIQTNKPKNEPAFLELELERLPEYKRLKLAQKTTAAWFKPNKVFDQWESKSWLKVSARGLFGPLLRKSREWAPFRPTHHEQMQSRHDREDAKEAILNKCSRPLFTAQVKSNIPLRSFWQSLSIPYLGQLSLSLKPSTCVFSSEELASFLSPPRAELYSKVLVTESTRYLPAPEDALDFELEDKKRHSLILGKTGMGKSSLLLNLMQADIQAGHCLAVMDPHGDLCEKLLQLIPTKDKKRIHLIDPSQSDHALAINPLELEDQKLAPVQASSLLEIFKALSHGSWGPRMEHILRNSLLTLLYAKNTSLLDLNLLLSKESTIKQLLNEIKDPLLKAFWENEWLGLPRSQRLEYAAPILNKLGPLLSHPIVRNCLIQPRAKLHFRKLIKPGSIILLPLPKAELGDEGSRILGMVFISLIQEALLLDRNELQLYLDEAHQFATPTLKFLLSESRKFGLGLNLAHQYLEQMPEEIRAAMLGNINNRFLFQCSFKDASQLAPELGITETDLTKLAPFQCYVDRLSNGKKLPLFRMETETNSKSINDQNRRAFLSKNELHEYTSKHYARPKAFIEVKLQERYNAFKRSLAHANSP